MLCYVSFWWSKCTIQKYKTFFPFVPHVLSNKLERWPDWQTSLLFLRWARGLHLEWGTSFLLKNIRLGLNGFSETSTLAYLSRMARKKKQSGVNVRVLFSKNNNNNNSKNNIVHKTIWQQVFTFYQYGNFLSGNLQRKKTPLQTCLQAREFSIRILLVGAWPTNTCIPPSFWGNKPMQPRDVTIPKFYRQIWQ